MKRGRPHTDSLKGRELRDGKATPVTLALGFAVLLV